MSQNSTKDLESLRNRVIAFSCLELDGQPPMMHMGTAYLVNDLWAEVQRLHEVLKRHQIDPETGDGEVG